MVHCVYVVQVCHLKTAIEGPININIRLNRKIFNYYDYSINYCTRKFTLKWHMCKSHLLKQAHDARTPQDAEVFSSSVINIALLQDLQYLAYCITFSVLQQVLQYFC